MLLVEESCKETVQLGCLYRLMLRLLAAAQSWVFWTEAKNILVQYVSQPLLSLCYYTFSHVMQRVPTRVNL